MSDHIIEKLKQVVDENYMVLLIPAGEKSGELLRKLSDQYGNFLMAYKVVLLTDMPDGGCKSDRICRISHGEMERIRTLYNTYEFSDHFHVLQTVTKYCGNLMNYVKNGILTEEECLQILLGIKSENRDSLASAIGDMPGE